MSVQVYLLRIEQGAPPVAPTFEKSLAALIALSPTAMSAGVGHMPAVSPMAIDPVAHRNEALALIGPDEAARAARLQDASRRDAFVYAHALLRWMLAQRLGVASPSALDFAKGPAGKPRLGHMEPALHFSISYRSGWAALALADAPCGIDVEPLRDGVDVDDLADHVFTNEERAYFNEVALAGRQAAFYSLWTRKEALVKAAGVGIERIASTSALRSSATVVDENGALRQYWVEELAAPPGLKLALALQVPSP